MKINIIGKRFETVIGKIVKFRPKTHRTFRIFQIDYPYTENRLGWCKGNVDVGRDLNIGDTVSLAGEWREDHQYPQFKEQLFFKIYEILSESKDSILETEPRESGSGNKEISETLLTFLKDAGLKKVGYAFHAPKHRTIAEHTRQQLDDRIVKATPEQQEFYFLTALLDRHVNDKQIQMFRQGRPDFQAQLRRCWEEAHDLLAEVVSNIAAALSCSSLVRHLKQQSPAFTMLIGEIPGDCALNQLLVGLKVVREWADEGEALSAHWSSCREECRFRDELRKIYGVGPKLANWALTNATGHWFVIDVHIQKTIESALRETLPPDWEISAEMSDAIFSDWFGTFNERERRYSRLAQDRLGEVFPGFEGGEAEYLPFIVTQTIWFYGKYCGERGRRQHGCMQAGKNEKN